MQPRKLLSPWRLWVFHVTKRGCCSFRLFVALVREDREDMEDMDEAGVSDPEASLDTEDAVEGRLLEDEALEEASLGFSRRDIAAGRAEGGSLPSMSVISASSPSSCAPTTETCSVAAASLE